MDTERTNRFPAGEPVRRYLMKMVHNSEGKALKIPAERDLAEMLGVSRGTVRDAIAALESQHFLIRLPGKKGAFTDPRAASLVSSSIGIISASNWFHYPTIAVIQGLSDALNDHDIDFSFHFEFLEQRKEEEFCRDLQVSGHSLLFSFGGMIYGKHAGDVLGRTGLPWLVYEEMACFDNEAAGKEIARFFRLHHAKNAVFWCMDDAKYTVFLKQIRKDGGECILVQKDIQDLPEKKLKGKLLKKADGIFVSSGLHNIKQMLDYLADQKSRIPVLLSPSEHEKLFLSQYPDLNLFFLDNGFYHQALHQAGYGIGCRASAVLKGQPEPEPMPLIQSYRLEKQ